MDPFILVVFAKLMMSVASNIVVPFLFDSFGRPFMNYRMPRVFGDRTVSGYMCGGFSETFSFQVSDDFTGELQTIGRNEILIAQSFDTGPVEFFVFDFTITADISEPVVFPYTFAIGRQSSFVREGLSVDFVRNGTGGFLRLNSSLESFESGTCVPGSLMVIEIPVNHGSHPLQASIKLEGQEERFSQGLFIDSTWFILGVPWILFRDITRIANATRSFGEPARIPNCDDILPLMPKIDIRFIFSTRSQGVLRLYPDDYTRRSSTDPTSCDLLLNENYGYRAAFNPLLIPGINIRFQRDWLILCDRSVHY